MSREAGAFRYPMRWKANLYKMQTFVFDNREREISEPAVIPYSYL